MSNIRRTREHVLDCGGKRSATPLFDSIAGTLPHALPKRCRRCALPPQSKTWRTFERFMESFNLQQWMRIGATNRGTFPGSAGVSPASSGFGSRQAGETPALPGDSWKVRGSQSSPLRKDKDLINDI